MTKDLKQARAEADAAKARLTDTVGELRYRMTPKVIARDAAQGAYSRTKRAIGTGNAAMRDRPWLPWAIGTALGTLGAIILNRRSRPSQATKAIDES